MATSNIQETGLENSIFFLEPSTAEDFGNDECFEGQSEEEINEQLNDQFRDYVNTCLIDNINEEIKKRKIDINLYLYDRYNETWESVDFEINTKGCYYEGANLIIESSYDLDDFDFSKTSKKKISILIRKLEKVMRIFSTELGVAGSFSNGETIYLKK